MIFVTVGTHEQQFNRLVEYMDKWAMKNDEEVIIQIGYSDYEPKFAKWERIFSYQQMKNMIGNARIIITHGGPSSFIAPLQIGKTPIVVPREKKYFEHVNDHQVIFCKEVERRMGAIIVIDDITELEKTIGEYNGIKNERKKQINCNNSEFCRNLNKLVTNLYNK